MWSELLGQKRSPPRHLGRPQRSRCWGLGARRCVWQSPAFARISRVTSRMRAGLSRGTQERDRRGHRGPGRPCVLQAQPGAAGRLVLGHGDSEAACLSLLQPQQLQPHVRGHKRFHRHAEGQMPLSAWTGSKRQRTCRRPGARIRRPEGPCSRPVDVSAQGPVPRSLSTRQARIYSPAEARLFTHARGCACLSVHPLGTYLIYSLEYVFVYLLVICLMLVR